MISETSKSPAPVSALKVRKVAIEEPTLWLEAGWRDFRRAPVLSVIYGLAFAAFGWGLAFGLEIAGLGSLILPLAAGFLLISPLAAVGLYEISRNHERGRSVSLFDAIVAWRRNADQIGMMGVALLVSLFAWIHVALIIFAMFFRGSPPTLAAFVGQLYALENVPFLLIGTAAGGILAAAVFAISVVSLPMLLDRQVTAAEAILTSIAAVRRNAAVMTGWAGTLAVLGFIGLATAFVGLIVTLPVAGYASWHAYRAMVRD